ncbi:MAG: nitrate reductase [Anaerolineales bacterium]|nr:MAG: nitrate reductase [Anaerolineales bacterium]
MGKEISRRTFLKVAAGAATASGLIPQVRRIALEPFVRPPEEELPGRATWFASTCRQCPAGCGIIVRVINGRARKIEGNPNHPLNHGKLCARGQAGLQVLYNPDRLHNAVRQSGGRGSRIFSPIPWSEALDELTAALQSLRDPQALAVLAGQPSDHLYTILASFLEVVGAPPAVIFDLHTALDGRAECASLSSRWFGEHQLPIYDLAHAQVVFSFGANLLETWMSPVAQSVAYGQMRQSRLGGRGVFVQFEPRLSATGASADEWIPVPPGTEGIIALALGRIIVEENLGRAGKHSDHAHLYRNVSVADAAQACGLPVEELRRLAHLFAETDRPLAIPGGQLTGHTNSKQAMDAVMALNVIMRRLGRHGGVFTPQPVPAERFASPAPTSNLTEILDLVERMRSGDIEIFLIHGANPIYELPAWVGFKEALEEVPLVISFSPFVDETAVQADLILPDHTYLEGWGYQVVSPGADRPIISGQQPVTQPLHDTRSTADILLSLASRLGGAVARALPWEDEAGFLEESSAQLHDNSISTYDARTPAGFWSLWRQHGGWWSKRAIKREPEAVGMPKGAMAVPAAAFQGDKGTYPFHLMPYSSLTLSDGRGANQPWLQEAPDPMTTARWNTWIEINPESARSLAIKDNDMVRVTSAYGSLQAAVVVYPGIRPDTVAIPTGQGHSDYGRFATTRGANVMDLLTPSPAEQGNKFAFCATRVRIEKVGQVKPLARLEDLDGEGRESIR